MGDRGCLTLFGDKPERHRMLADHLTAETYRPLTDKSGRASTSGRSGPAAPTTTCSTRSSAAPSPPRCRASRWPKAGGWRVRQMWGWVYRDGMITSAWPKEGFDRLAPAFDPICYATKGKVLLRLEREGDKEWVRRQQRCSLSTRSIGNHASGSACGHWPRSILAEDVPDFEYFAYRRAQKDADATGHPNQKPLALMRWLLSKLPRGWTILDPYAGSATTLIAAIEEGLSAIGIEKEADHFALAQRRIDAALASTPLFDPDRSPAPA
jgi:hypothetical protein